MKSRVHAAGGRVGQRAGNRYFAGHSRAGARHRARGRVLPSVDARRRCASPRPGRRRLRCRRVPAGPDVLSVTAAGPGGDSTGAAPSTPPQRAGVFAPRRQPLSRHTGPHGTAACRPACRRPVRAGFADEPGQARPAGTVAARSRVHRHRSTAGVGAVQLAVRAGLHRLRSHVGVAHHRDAESPACQRAARRVGRHDVPARSVLHRSRMGGAERTAALFSGYDPSSSPIGFSSSTRSQTAFTTSRIGTPSSSPQIPHSQPHASTPTKMATGFIRLAWLVSQGVSR